MKSVIISSVIFILIILLLIFSTTYTVSKSKAIDYLLERLSDAAKDDDWDKCNRLFNESDSIWSKSEPIFAALFRHDELDDITRSFEILSSHIKQKDKNRTLTEVKTLEFHVSHLREKDKIQFENLF